jgi:hypothetical protein
MNEDLSAEHAERLRALLAQLPRRHPPPDPWEAKYYALLEEVVTSIQARRHHVDID